MPIIKYQEKLIHFAHIPKTGGTSVLLYLSSIPEIKIGFHDYLYFDKDRKKKWNISSPQHIDGNSFSKLFDKSFFDKYFTVVRNPIKKFISAYKHQKFQEKKINDELSINQFIQEVLIHKYHDIGWMDNHFLPQSSFLYPNQGYSIFKLEGDGMTILKKYLDKDLIGYKINKNIPNNSLFNKNLFSNKIDLTLNEESKRILHEIYRKDFKQFNYGNINIGDN